MNFFLNNFFFKLKSLYQRSLIYFYYTAKPAYINPIFYQKKIKEMNAKRYIESIPELYNLILRTTKKSDSTGVSFCDYRKLYETIRQLKPKNVLELGSGISTSVMAYALKQNEIDFKIKGIVTSMEEDETFFNQVKTITDKNLVKYINLLKSSRKTKYVNGMLASYYHKIPKKNYEFIFIDGPTLWGALEKKSGSEKTFNCDILTILSKWNVIPKCILLDKKIGTMWSLQKCLPETKFDYNNVMAISEIKYKKGQKIIL